MLNIDSNELNINCLNLQNITKLMDLDEKENEIIIGRINKKLQYMTDNQEFNFKKDLKMYSANI